MLRKLTSLFGGGAPPPSPPPPPAAGRYAPYRDASTNFIYNLIFCDQPELFRPQPGTKPAPWQTTLFAERPDAKAIGALAADPRAEARVRMLACSWLRANGASAPGSSLFGMIGEAAMPGGLDTLAAFSDGSVRYINHSESMTIVDDRLPQLREPIQKLFDASINFVQRLRPTTEPRKAPPAGDVFRCTFLTSSGVCTGEGAMMPMQNDAVAGPVVVQMAQLISLLGQLPRK